ncbi:MAG: O-antigen ligase family protein [Alphaproteobacteria bacterium]|nr:O-antigen ligase family protein [Alphaproteobacteria bacterium]
MADSNSINLARIDLPRAAFWLFAASIVLLPIGLGGDRPFSLGLGQCGLALSCALLAADKDIWRETVFFTRIRWALGLLGIVLVWAFVQTLGFVPVSWMHPLWQETAATLGQPLHGSISVAPEDSLKGLTRLLTYIVAGLLGYVLGQETLRARRLVEVLWGVGSLICLYGLIVQAAGIDRVLWFAKTAYIGDLTATFINHNHFAIYAGLVLVSGLALTMQSWREHIVGARPHQKVALIRQWLLKQGLPRFFVLALILTAIILSHSRAGLVISLFGVGLYLFFYQVYLHAWRRAWMIGLAMTAVIVLFIVVAASVSDHFASLFADSSSIDRAKIYDLGWHVLQDNPWLGYGLNGFEPEYRLYQPGMVPEFNHLHNDILESLIDLGVAGGLILWAAVALLLSGLWHGIMRRRQNGLYPTLALTVSFMVLAHALVDFDLQIPGVAMTWTALLGTGLAQSWRRAEKRAL